MTAALESHTHMLLTSPLMRFSFVIFEPKYEIEIIDCMFILL